MGILHTWNVFRRTRIAVFSLTILLNLALALIILVTLVSGWAIYDVPQKAISTVVFLINLFSTLCLIIMSLTRIRPLADLAWVAVLLLFQIGSVVAYTLIAPSMPCSGGGLLISCRVGQSTILYGSCASCVLLCFYLVFLFPILRLPQNQLSPSLAKPDEKLLVTFSDTASSLTYYSWDRKPSKDSKHTSMDTYYSQASYAGGYNFSMYDKGRQSSNQPYPFVSRGHAPSPLAQPTTPQNHPNLLRPFTPPPSEPLSAKSSARASVSSIASQDTAVYAASWLMEPPRAVLSPKSPQKPAASNPLVPPDLTGKTSSFMTQDKGRKGFCAHQKKHRPQMLSLGTLRDLDSVTLSDVPRSPSPIESCSPCSPFPPTPRSGVLPKHPRLTMHLRDIARAQTRIIPRI